MQRDDPVADDNTQCDEIVSEEALFFVCCVFIFTKYKAVCCQYNAIVSLMSLFSNNFTCRYDAKQLRLMYLCMRYPYNEIIQMLP